MKKWLSLCFWWASFLSHAQNLNYVGIIPTLSQTGRLHSRLTYNLFISETLDLFDNTTDGVYYPSKPLQLYIQPSLTWLYSPNWNFAGSVTYNYQRSNPDVPYFREIRPWEQAVYGHSLFGGRMTHRLRFEQRFIQNQVTEKWPMTTRLRYQIGFSIPLQGTTLDDGEFYFNCYTEYYFTLTVPEGTRRNALYSEFWAYAGIGYQTKKYGRLEVGPLAQYNVRDIQHDLRNLYLLQIAWITNFNFKKQE